MGARNERHIRIYMAVPHTVDCKFETKKCVALIYELIYKLIYELIIY